ncbi:DUF4019 domain-containing protein [Sphingomonas sp. MMS24-JH45]
MRRSGTRRSPAPATPSAAPTPPPAGAPSRKRSGCRSASRVAHPGDAAGGADAPNGGWTVRFRTDFEHKRGAIETLSLVREGGAWKVAGIYLE